MYVGFEENIATGVKKSKKLELRLTKRQMLIKWEISSINNDLDK